VSIDPVSASTGASLYATPAVSAPKQVMDSSMFMSLLVTQLQNQDPSSPMDTNQMIGQTTQLAMMEKITDMTTTGQENFSLQMRMAAAALVGKQVSYTATDGSTASGVASAVSYAGAVPQITIDGKTVALDSVSGVTDGTMPTAATAAPEPASTPVQAPAPTAVPVTTTA